jgi:cellulose biosynthesis protein BcsQ
MEKTRVTAFVSRKGGVGKSSSAVMTANYLAALGKSVLVVDADYGNSLTLSYIEDRNFMKGKGFARAVKGKDIAGNIVPTKRENVDILSSNTDMEGLRMRDPDALANLFEAEAETLSVYDNIVIDTAGGYSGVTAAVIKASDLLLTPYRLSLFDYAGCTSLYNEMKALGKYEAWRIFFNEVSRYAEKPGSAQNRYIKECREWFPQCLNLFVPQAVAVLDAVDWSKSVKRKGNEKLHGAVRRLAGLAAGEEVGEVEAF